jgi:hypothetical protein
MNPSHVTPSGKRAKVQKSSRGAMKGDLGFATRNRILRSPTKHRAPLRECNVNVPAHPPSPNIEQSSPEAAKLVDEDFAKTTREAEAGDLRSEKLLGAFYSRMGDFTKAALWYLTACEQGDLQ